jgi:RING finger family protein
MREKRTSSRTLQSRLNSLRVNTFPSLSLSHKHKMDECAICLSILDFSENNVFQLPCGHRFHKECVKPCIVGATLRCPICRFIHEPNYLGEFGVDLVTSGVAQVNGQVDGLHQEIQTLVSTVSALRQQSGQWRQRYERKTAQLATTIQGHMGALRLRDEVIGLKK